MKKSNKTVRRNNKNPRSRNGFLWMAILAVVVIAGIVYIAVHMAHDRAVAAMPTVLTITREHLGNGDFSVNVKDQATANAILNEARKLPLVPKGTVSCPNDDGVTYTMKFASPSVVLVADASGCQTVKLSDSSNAYSAVDATNFWKDVHIATGKPIDPSSTTKYY